MSADSNSWQPEIEELNRRRDLMQKMGGESIVHSIVHSIPFPTAHCQ